MFTIYRMVSSTLRKAAPTLMDRCETNGFALTLPGFADAGPCLVTWSRDDYSSTTTRMDVERTSTQSTAWLHVRRIMRRLCARACVQMVTTTAFGSRGWY